MTILYIGITALMNRFFGKRVHEGRSRSRPPTPTGILSPPFRTGQRISGNGNGGGEQLTGSLTAQLARAAVGSRNGEVISVLLRSSPAILSKRLLGAVLIAGIVCTYSRILSQHIRVNLLIKHKRIPKHL